MQQQKETHLTPIGYLLWMLTAGVFLIGWIVDAFLIPGMNRDAHNQFKSGARVSTCHSVMRRRRCIFDA